MNNILRNCGLGVALASLIFADALPVAAAPAHEEGGKLEYIADHLAATAHRFEPLNLELVDELQLTTDDEVDTPVETPVGPLTTADLFVSGDHAFLGSFGNAVHVVDLSQPHDLTLVAQVPTPGPAVDVKVRDGLAVVGVQKRGDEFGLMVLDVSNPADPRVVGELSVSSWRGVHNLFLAEGRAYLAPIGSDEQVRGVVVVDLADPARPSIAGNWVNEQPGFSNRIHDVFVDDGIAYVSDFFSGLVLLDLAVPDRPVTLASVPFSEGIHSAWAHNGYVYCNQEFGGPERPLHIVDATDPAAPIAAGSFRADVPLESATIGPHNPYASEGWLYWAYYDAGLRVFDISIPDRPIEVARHPSTLAWGAHPHTDGHVYVADSRRGLRAFRFDAPAFAVREIAVGSPAFAGRPARIEVSTEPLPNRTDEGIVRVAASLNAAASPVVVDLRDDGAGKDAMAGDGVYTGSLPVPANTAAGAHTVRVWIEDDGGAVYPLDGMLEVQPDLPTAVAGQEPAGAPAGFELAQNYPNPFNGDTVFYFTLDAGGPVELAIYNPLGQRLATVVDGMRAAGGHALHWDGRDDDGRPLASGAYLYRLSAGGRQLSRKLLLVQ